MEPLSFPLSVKDANMEIISYLDDDALYNLCKTNKSSERLCESTMAWSANRPSQLAPLNFLQSLYRNWIDFYENVRNDYIYVVVADVTIRYHRNPNIVRPNITFYPVTSIKSAFALIKTFPTIMQVAGTIFATYYNKFEIGLARKNKLYDLKAYDFLLFELTDNTEFGDYYNWPVLNLGHPIVLAQKNIKQLSTEIPTNLYCDFTDVDLHRIMLSNYSTIHIRYNDIMITFSERLDTSIYLGLFGIKSTFHMFVIPDYLIDGTNKILIVTLPTDISIYSTKFNDFYRQLTRMSRNEIYAEYFKMYGTFYKLQDLFDLIAASNYMIELNDRS